MRYEPGFDDLQKDINERELGLKEAAELMEGRGHKIGFQSNALDIVISYAVDINKIVYLREVAIAPRGKKFNNLGSVAEGLWLAFNKSPETEDVGYSELVVSGDIQKKRRGYIVKLVRGDSNLAMSVNKCGILTVGGNAPEVNPGLPLMREDNLGTIARRMADNIGMYVSNQN